MSPSYYHSAIAGTIITEINNTDKFRAFAELTLIIDGNDYIPDVSVYKRQKIKYHANEDILKMEEMPLLTIEVLSPSQNMNDLIAKAKLCLQNGIKSVWIIQPFAHTISVFTKEEVKLCHNGIIEDISGVKVDLAVIFED